MASQVAIIRPELDAWQLSCMIVTIAAVRHALPSRQYMTVLYFGAYFQSPQILGRPQHVSRIFNLMYLCYVCREFVASVTGACIEMPRAGSGAVSK